MRKCDICKIKDATIKASILRAHIYYCKRCYELVKIYLSPKTKIEEIK